MIQVPIPPQDPEKILEYLNTLSQYLRQLQIQLSDVQELLNLKNNK